MNSDLNKKVVTDEIAIKLKELNYDDECIFCRTDISEKLRHKIATNNNGGCSISWDRHDNELPLPLWQDVIDWFREKHDLWIDVTYYDYKLRGIITHRFDGEIFAKTFNIDEFGYKFAREKTILKAIEIVNEKNIIKEDIIIEETTLPKYLVRPNDFSIFDLDESNNCYRSWSKNPITYTDGTRPNAMSHFTYDNLTKNYGFFNIDESEIETYTAKSDEYHKFISWQTRSDGHGGSKGGTYEEYLEYLKRYEKK
jgi:hypothetical protein